MKRFTINLPDELHKRFKIACAQEVREMSEIVRASILAYVEIIERRQAKKK